MKTIPYLLVIATFAVWSVAGRAGEKAPEEHNPPAQLKPFHFWMEVKLKESQSIFASLAAADFEAVVESAESLKTLNTMEAFVRRREPGYRTQLNAFLFAVDEIQKQAEEENIEGVALGFHQLTISCVHCHKQLRDQSNAKP